MGLGDRIKQLRIQNSIDRSNLAKSIGITYHALSKYETNEREPDYETIKTLADYFNVTTDYLLGHEQAPSYVAEESMQYNKKHNIQNIKLEIDKSDAKVVRIEIDSSKNRSKEAILASLKEGLEELAEEGHFTDIQVKNIMEFMTKKIENNEY